MTLTDWLLLTMAAVAAVSGGIGWAWRGAADERRAFDGQIAGFEQELEARHAPKHARGAPREFPVSVPEMREIVRVSTPPPIPARISDTGELRRLGDEICARIRREEAEWRKESGLVT